MSHTCLIDESLESILREIKQGNIVIDSARGKANNTNRHHYSPQAYQQAWAINSSGLVMAYRTEPRNTFVEGKRIQTDTLIGKPCSIAKCVGHEIKLYEYAEGISLEEEFFANIENHGHKVLGKIRAGATQLTGEEYVDLFIYFTVMKTRHPRFMNSDVGLFAGDDDIREYLQKKTEDDYRRILQIHMATVGYGIGLAVATGKNKFSKKLPKCVLVELSVKTMLTSDNPAEHLCKEPVSIIPISPDLALLYFDDTPGAIVLMQQLVNMTSADFSEYANLKTMQMAKYALTNGSNGIERMPSAKEFNSKEFELILCNLGWGLVNNPSEAAANIRMNELLSCQLTSNGLRRCPQSSEYMRCKILSNTIAPDYSIDAMTKEMKRYQKYSAQIIKQMKSTESGSNRAEIGSAAPDTSRRLR